MAQEDFLEQYVEQILVDAQVNLTQEQKATYVPQLTGLLQQRIGMDLVPQLTPEQLDAFTNMIQSGQTDAGQWQTFWQQTLPNFEEELQKTLVGFRQDVTSLLAAQ